MVPHCRLSSLGLNLYLRAACKALLIRYWLNVVEPRWVNSALLTPPPSSTQISMTTLPVSWDAFTTMLLSLNMPAGHLGNLGGGGDAKAVMTLPAIDPPFSFYMTFAYALRPLDFLMKKYSFLLIGICG